MIAATPAAAGGHLLACARATVLGVLALAGAVPALILAAAVAAPVAGCAVAVAGSGPLPVRLAVAAAGVLVGLLGVVLVAPLVGLVARWVSATTRVLAGIDLPDPAPVGPSGAVPMRLFDRVVRPLVSPVARRDLLWLVVNGCAAGVLLAPAGLIGLGVVGFIGPVIGPPIAVPPPAFPGNTRVNLIAIGLAFVGLALWISPRLLRRYGALARLVLAGGRQAELTRRLHELALTRAETIDTAAAEMRRIERDLHDGAQARLVAMGMTLDAAAQTLDADPQAARVLLDEARAASARALAELRDLIRGIHPPVLADRGFADAIRALALDSAVPTQLTGHLPARPPSAIESAAYFAVCELLANTAKHARAGHIGIDVRHTAGALRVSVTDDGHGGADPTRGTGLRGIQRRLAVFDGTLAIASPPGGPTTVTMEIPCALSWPKTSSSSGTA